LLNTICPVWSARFTGFARPVWFASSIYSASFGSKQSRDPNRILENLQICYFYPYR